MIEGGNLTYANWGFAQPSHAENHYVLSVHVPNGKWYNEPSASLYPYICEITTAYQPFCPNSSWYYYPRTGFCYMNISNEHYWVNQNEACEDAGGELASIHSWGENVIVGALVNNFVGSYNNQAFIGLYLDDQNQPQWSDGSNYTFTKIQNSYFNYYYIYGNKDTEKFLWDSVNNDNRNAAICKAPTFN